MAYPHYMIEVQMTGRAYADAVSSTPVGEWSQGGLIVGANPSTIGVAMWAPVLIPHKLHMVGMLLIDNAGVSIARDFTFRVNPSNSASAVGAATDNVCILGFPAGGIGATAAAGAVNRPIYHMVTKNVVVMPGQYVKVLTTGAVTMAARFSLLVSPVWEQPGNVTQMVSSVT